MSRLITILIITGVFILSRQCGYAQGVVIDIPVSKIVNRTDLDVERAVMNTKNSTGFGLFAPDPTFRARSANFIHSSRGATFLPAEVLQWRLLTIGNQRPSLGWGGSWPGYKVFSLSAQNWLHIGFGAGFTPGSIDFSFKIPAAQFSTNAFASGEYVIQVDQNYTSATFFAPEFSPPTINVILSVPPFLSWTTNNAGKYITISSLDNYRNLNGDISIDLDNYEVANSVDFKLRAKLNSQKIQFTTTKGLTSFIEPPSIKLSSPDSRLRSESLTTNWQNFPPGANSFTVETGNRNTIPLALSVSAADLKTYFFEAGTYTFSIVFDARSTDNTISQQQTTEVVIKVPALSEITVPPGMQDVNFQFNTLDKYNQGETKTVPNQLRLSNNESFELYVKADAPTFRKNGVRTQLPSTVLQLGVEGNPLVPLSPTASKIITNGQPVLDQNLNMKYSISPAAAQSLVPYEKSTYSINVIYSFTAL